MVVLVVREGDWDTKIPGSVSGFNPWLRFSIVSFNSQARSSVPPNIPLINLLFKSSIRR